ncbi:12004_t:CDS:1 [Cetraspora pellucida]|uniref:12004_t:CDS:1 n=1 Tax=Cetraspora pellucida TaxID=1433469 RepID=A0ACA9KTN9_9GLOM|nr:12004_t:CDS:1 [Cetraspora pellucida]
MIHPFLFLVLAIGFSFLFTRTIYKSESICSDNSEKIEGWLFTNNANYEESFPVYNTMKNIINSLEQTSFIIEKIIEILKHSLIIETLYKFQISCSNYKLKNNIIDQNIYSMLFYCQSNRIKVVKIIESLHSLHNNQFYKVPSPENLIIGLHYSGYSASYIEIKYFNYLYSIFQSLQNTSTLNSEDYKTPNENYVLKQENYSSAIETTISNKISILNNTIIEAKDICDSVEEGNSLSEEIIDIDDIQQKINNTIHDINGECKEFKILYLNPICYDVKI